MPTKKTLNSLELVWEAPTKSVIQGTTNQDLPGAWKLMLLGDGSPTRHLQLLTGHEVSVKVISMEIENSLSKSTPKEVNEIEPPFIRRQVWLQCGDKTLAWAESWWNIDEAKHHLKNKNQPIWRSLTQGRSELFREVDGLALANAKWLESTFERKGPFWTRHYRFFRNGKELTVIREVFSPELENWLGPVERKSVETNI